MIFNGEQSMIFKKTILALAMSSISLSAFSAVHEFKHESQLETSTPSSQGWQSRVTNSGSSSWEDDGWVTNGNNGGFEWRKTLSEEDKQKAERFGWTLESKLKVLSGNYITNYYSDGSHRVLPILSIENNNLYVEFSGNSGKYLIASGDEATSTHVHELVFNPATDTASYFVDGRLIKKDIQKESSSHDFVSWGNGSTYTDGVASYNYVKLHVNGDEIFRSPDRIPSIVASSKTKGTVVAFAEKRVGGSDPGWIGNTNDIIAKVSKDYGVTWSEEINLTEEINKDDEFDFSDPRPIYDEVHDSISVSYVRWDTDAAQNGDQVKYWMNSGVFTNDYDVANDRWTSPSDVTEQVKERTYQILGWDGSEYYTKNVEIDSSDDWNYNIKAKIIEGSDNTFSVSNGQTSYSVSFEVDERGLVAFNGESESIVIDKTYNFADFVEISIRHYGKLGEAELYVNDRFVDIVAKIPSSNSEVKFGQTSLENDGRVHVAVLELIVNEEKVVSFDAEHLATINPSTQDTSLTALGWTKHHSGQAISNYGNASVNPGPGHGIALEKYNNRFVYPSIVLDKYFLNVSSVYSDDFGKTWKIGQPIKLPRKWQGSILKTLEPSESDIVELKNGDLLMTSRLDFNKIVEDKNYTTRHQFLSKDGGVSWKMLENQDISVFPNISSAAVDASITRFEEENGESYLIFTNPIGNADHNGRENLGLWFSFDEGDTWSDPIQLVVGGSAYSDIYQLDDKNAIVIFEDNSTSIRTLTVPVSNLKQLVK